MSEYRSGYVNSHALIVGINTYSDPRFMPLGQAESDAQAMAALLGAPPYDFNITQLLGAQATKGAILKALNQLRRAQTDDRVLVYFAGHGYTLSDRLGNETGFLACADTVPEEDYSALKLEDVIDLTRHSEAKHIGFIFDACFSGQALGLTRAPSVTADKLMQRRAYQVISAGAGDQTVSDYSSMTGRIVEALQSGALMSDGLVTLGELGLHVQQTITSDSHQTQIPQFGHIRGSQGGDFVFYVDTAVRLPAELEDVLRSNRATVRLSGVIELIELANDSENELSQVARDRLASIIQTEPEERVREAAQSYFDELEAQREADEALAEAQRKAEEAHRRADAARQSRNLTPPKMPKPQVPAPASEPEPEPEPPPAHTDEAWSTVNAPMPKLNLKQQAAYTEPEPAAATPPPAPVIAVSKTVDVSMPEAKAAPMFSSDVVSARDRAASKAAPKAGKPSLPLPMPVMLGIGGVIVLLIIGILAASALGLFKKRELTTPGSKYFPYSTELGLPAKLKLEIEDTTLNEEVADRRDDPDAFMQLLEDWGRNIGYTRTYWNTDGCNTDGYYDAYFSIAIYDTSTGSEEAFTYYEEDDKKDHPDLVRLNVGEKATYYVWEEDVECTPSIDIRIGRLHFKRYNGSVVVQVSATKDDVTEAELQDFIVDLAQTIDDEIREKVN